MTTYFIPDEQNDSETSTSIEKNDVIQTDLVFECKTQKQEAIQATSVQNAKTDSTASPEKSGAVKISVRNKLASRPRHTTQAPQPTTTDAEQTSTESSDEVEQQIDDDPNELGTTTEGNSEANTVEAITSSISTSSTTEANKNKENDDNNDIELIYKTLFTTYTYRTYTWLM